MRALDFNTRTQVTRSGGLNRGARGEGEGRRTLGGASRGSPLGGKGDREKVRGVSLSLNEEAALPASLFLIQAWELAGRWQRQLEAGA